jgi:hypothetical protein
MKDDNDASFQQCFNCLVERVGCSHQWYLPTLWPVVAGSFLNEGKNKAKMTVTIRGRQLEWPL